MADSAEILDEEDSRGYVAVVKENTPKQEELDISPQMFQGEQHQLAFARQDMLANISSAVKRTGDIDDLTGEEQTSEF